MEILQINYSKFFHQPSIQYSKHRFIHIFLSISAPNHICDNLVLLCPHYLEKEFLKNLHCQSTLGENDWGIHKFVRIINIYDCIFPHHKYAPHVKMLHQTGMFLYNYHQHTFICMDVYCHNCDALIHHD